MRNNIFLFFIPGLFCRDPETGKLHPVNSTWTASTFCGTYHCKVRRKNITNAQYAPTRLINVTNIQLLGENLTTVEIKKGERFVKKEEVVKDVISTDNKTIPTIDANDTLTEIQEVKITDDIDGKNVSETDRLLTEQEIQSLTEILHTVKKGDLDAIVEIYNLAQDIYKELDQTSTVLTLQETMSTAKTLGQQMTTTKLFKKVPKSDHASYWYEPLASNIKIRLTDMARSDLENTDINPDIPAMVIRMKVPLPSANVTNATTNATEKPLLVQILPSIPIPKAVKPNMQKAADDFFNSPLSHNDFGKLPYYYPMSKFQRISSYKHDQKKTLLGKTRGQVVTRRTLAPVQVTTPGTTPVHTMERSEKPVAPQTRPRIPEQKSERIPAQTYAQMIESIPSRKSEPTQERILMVRFPASMPARIPARFSAPMPARQPALPARQPALPARQPALPGRQPALPARQPAQVPTRTTTLRPAPVLAPAPKPHKTVKSKPLKTGTKYKKELRPSIFLPYPFTNMQQHTNWSLIQSLYNGHHLGKLEALRTKQTPFKKLKSPIKDDSKNYLIPMKRHKDVQDNVILMNPDLEYFQDSQIRPSINKETVVTANGKQTEHRVPEIRKPAWLTGSLPQHIIEEVRAHIHEKHKKFIHTVPFRKKVKLERVGTLFNMEQLSRTKRESEEKNATQTAPLEHELFEVFIDKTT